MKSGMIAAFFVGGLLLWPEPLKAQSTDPDTIWPLCGRITENKPKRWRPSKGCPAERFGNPVYSDAPFSSTFGPRPLGSENDRFDFHRGVDIATPTGTPFFAVTAGNVEIAGVNSSYSDPLIKLRHYRPGETTCSGGGGCYHSYYLHISDWVVSVDEWVEKGDLIGYTGASGSGFQHIHFEVRDAPAFDPFSGWSRDAIHPFSVLPYAVPNQTTVNINAVDTTDPAATTASVTVASNRYDLVSVEMTVRDAAGNEIPQTGNTPDANGYHVLPAFYDMNSWNFEYSHKDSSAYPWEDFGAGGILQCPYHSEHGASYSAHVHMDAQDPADFHVGLFNGVQVTTSKYWLIGNRDYLLDLEFQALQGPAACVEAFAVFASGDVSSQQWGSCPGTPNQPPQAAFTDACNALDCSFDGAASSDSDGSISSWAWDFGDGNSASGAQVAHSFAATGTYSVTLTVTDDLGATDSVQRNISVEAPPTSDIVMTLSANKKGNRVAVRWTGAVLASVDVYRDGSLQTTTANDGQWNDRNVSAGNTYLYQVCEAGSANDCSEAGSIQP